MVLSKTIFYIFILFFTFSFQDVLAQPETENVSSIFEKYKTDRNVLPDFSYVGYHHGEKAIPNIKAYKIFDVTQFGAIPNDTISDKTAIQKAIGAANKNGSGIVFFPKGRFLINEDSDNLVSIISRSSKIILRGSGSGQDGTELYMKNPLLPKNPDLMNSVPSFFIFTTLGKDEKIGKVTKVAKVGDFDLTMDHTTNLKSGDWIVLSMLNNDPELIDAEIAPYKVSPKWTYLVENGVDVKVFHQIGEVKKQTITLKTPLTYNIDPKYNWKVELFANSEEIGVEDIAFVGNWKEKFVHHQSWKDDGGFTFLQFEHITNSWIRNCRFTDCNVAAFITQSANISVINCLISGNPGHKAIVSYGSTNVLFAKLVDEASMWHSFGSANGSMNTVLWRCSYPPTTCFESHSSQPRNTLLDLVEGGLLSNRAGGAVQNLPNHMQGLVLWNYKQTNKPIQNFQFWPANRVWWKIPNPVIVGFSGGTTFQKDQVGYMESIGKWVAPNSLYEAQLVLRLGQLPEWLNKLK